jgi:hypothetical protein
MQRDSKVAHLADKYIKRDGSAPAEPTEADLDALTEAHDQERILATLGEMSPAEYGRRRDVIAADLDTTRAYLDAWSTRNAARPRRRRPRVPR